MIEYGVEMFHSRSIINEKVEREFCIDYTNGAAEKDFVRDY